jgi:hypothetical protein
MLTEKVVSNPGYSNLHRNKTTNNLQDFLEEQGLLSKKRSNNEWLVIERNTALMYMSLLAKYLAEIDKKQTTIGTDYGVYERFNFVRVKERDGFPVVSLNLTNILPVPIPNIPLEKIIDYKKKRKDELLQFRKVLMEFQSKISKSKSNQEAKELSVAFQESLKIGLKGLTATLRDSRIETIFKSMKSLISLKSPTTLV